MTPDEVFSLAREAILQMADAHGPRHSFSYDQIWTFGSAATVPSAQRPGPQRRLIREGFIKKTGGLRNASSEARAGSLTPEYVFGAAVLGDRAASEQTKLIDVLKDGRTGCLSLLATMSADEYLNFVENAYYEREGGVEGQRTPLKTNTALRIRKTMIADLEAGAILPPVVVGIVLEANFTAAENITNSKQLQDLLDNTPEESISVIDGMQRTAALIQLRDKPPVVKRNMRVEFWIAQNTNSLIYRMLVLNTGQVPWDLRRQIEVIHKPLLKELENSTTLVKALQKNENRRRAQPGQFQADRIIELYMVFGARKEKIDTKERLADEFTRLDFIEATSVSVFTQQFFGVVELMAKLDACFDRFSGDEEADRFKAGKDLFSSQPACVGFVAAVSINAFGRPGSPDRTLEQQNASLDAIKANATLLLERLNQKTPDEVGAFLDFTTLNEALTTKNPGRLGDFQREFFLKAFQTLIDEKFSVDSMTPCWRAY